MTEQWVRRSTARFVISLAIAFRSLGLTANGLTILGCLLQIGVGVMLAYGLQRPAAVLLIFAAGLDGVDGTLARLLGGTTRFGAFLDSVLDRISESAVFLGLGWWYMSIGEPLPAMLAYLAIVGSILVSYSRARAEAIGVECRVGLFTRAERVVLMVIVLLFGWTTIGLWILSVGTILTTFHRIIHVFTVTRRDTVAVAEGDPANEQSAGL